MGGNANAISPVAKTRMNPGTVSTFISSELMTLEFDPDELNALEQRMNAIESLKRKYGGSIEAVLETKDNIIQEMSSLNDPQNSEKELLNTIEEKEKIFFIMITFLALQFFLDKK